jgi:23S rRNA pseudouridine2457 synthase
MSEYHVLLFNKPFGVPSTFTDELGRATLKAYIPVDGVYSAGRLDLESEGLLVLTDDRDLLRRLTDPAYPLPTTYLVQVEGTITPDALAQLERGVELQGQRTNRCRVMAIAEPNLPPRSKPVTPHGPTHWLRLELVEGKKRQIRQMTAAVGLPTLRLIQVAVGPLHLGELKSGEWRELSDEEIRRLRDVLKKAAATSRNVSGSKISKLK